LVFYDIFENEYNKGYSALSIFARSFSITLGARVTESTLSVIYSNKEYAGIGLGERKAGRRIQEF
jgi:hypothetical protein